MTPLNTSSLPSKKVLTELEKEDFIRRLREELGDTYVLTTKDTDLTTYEIDWRAQRKGKALAVALPANAQEVAAVVKLCAQTHVSIVTQGGNTSLVCASTPDTTAQQIVLSTKRLNHIRAIDTQNMTITVDAGCILQLVQQAADEAGYFYPLSLGAEGSCTLGGNLATNAGGTGVLRYGNSRELCLGLEFVTATGEIVSNLAGLRKNNTGYDLRHLLIGSEGTLGIITAATLKLFPKPTVQLSAWLQTNSLQECIRLLALAQQNLSTELTGFEAMNAHSLRITRTHYPQLTQPLVHDHDWMVLLEMSSHNSQTYAQTKLNDFLAQAIECNCVIDGVVAQNLAQINTMWQIREHIPLAQSKDGINIKHDISLPISNIADFVDFICQQLAEDFPNSRIINYGHLGDGNLHFNIHAPQNIDPQEFVTTHEPTINDMVYKAVHRFNGSFSAEHGVGSLKIDQMKYYKSPATLDVMRAIKHAMDPLNILNPGCTVPFD